MGLAVLPSRLLSEMQTLEDAILKGKKVRDVPGLEAHAPWAEDILKRHPEFLPENVSNNEENAAGLSSIIRDEIGFVFSKVLEQCGVYKDSEDGRNGFLKFAEQVNAR